MDDEFIGYIYRFTNIFNTGITGVHDIFINKILKISLEDPVILEMQ
jgi:hypothetical protein